MPAEELEWTLYDIRWRVLVLTQGWVVQVYLLLGGFPGCWLAVNKDRTHLICLGDRWMGQSPGLPHRPTPLSPHHH